MYHIEKFLLGEDLLDEMIQALRDYADYETLMEVISESDPTKLSWSSSHSVSTGMEKQLN